MSPFAGATAIIKVPFCVALIPLKYLGALRSLQPNQGMELGDENQEPYKLHGDFRKHFSHISEIV